MPYHTVMSKRYFFIFLTTKWEWENNVNMQTCITCSDEPTLLPTLQRFIASFTHCLAVQRHLVQSQHSHSVVFGHSSQQKWPKSELPKAEICSSVKPSSTTFHEIVTSRKQHEMYWSYVLATMETIPMGQGEGRSGWVDLETQDFYPGDWRLCPFSYVMLCDLFKAKPWCSF